MLGDHSPWVPHISASFGTVTDLSSQDVYITQIYLLPIIEDLISPDSEFLSLTQPTMCLGVLFALLCGNWDSELTSPLLHCAGSNKVLCL